MGKFEYPQGKLLDMAKLIDINSVQHACDIQRERHSNKDLRDMWFWTADFLLYTLEGGQAILYIADGKHNLAFKNLDDAVMQLRIKNNYFPNDSDIEDVIKARSTLRVPLSGLELQINTMETSYFEIYTENYAELNAFQRAVAEKIHGEGEAFERTMKMLLDPRDDSSYYDITKTKIYLLTPEYIRSTLEKNNAKAMVQLSVLDNFSNGSSFGSDGMYIEYHTRRLLGSSMPTLLSKPMN